MLIAFLLAAAPASNTCTKLADAFVKNERDMAFQHYINESLIQLSVKWKLDDVEKYRKQLETDDEQRKLDGDRITTLILANKCRPPDHVTSWKTYQNEVEKAKERPAASGAAAAKD